MVGKCAPPVSAIKMTSEVGLRVAELLYKTFSSTVDSERKAAEEQLKALSLDIIVYAQTLLSLISAGHQDISSKIKSSAAVQLRQTVRSAVDDGSLQIDQRTQIGLMVFQVLTNVPLESSVRGSLGYCLNPLLSTDNHDPHSETCKRLQPHISAALSGGSLPVQGALRTLKSLYSGISSGQTGNLLEFYQQINPKLIDIARQSLTQLAAAIQAAQPAAVQEVISLLEEWSNATNAVLEFFELSSNKTLKDICQDFQLAEVFVQLLLFRMPDAHFAQPSIIAVESNPTSQAYNNIKCQILQSVNLLLQYLIDHKKKSMEESGGPMKVMTLIGASLPPSPFVNTVLQVIEPLILTLMELSNQSQLDEILQMEFVSDLVIETLLLLYKCTSETVFYQTFLACYKALAVNVCLTFLRCSQNEMESLNTTPEEFATLALDTCERQESQTVKTTAAQLLESLCSFVYGALSYTVTMLVQLIDFTITGSNLAAIQSYPVLAELQGRSVLLLASEEIRIETSLMAFCVLAYTVQKRGDLSILVERIMTTHLSTLVNVRSGLVQARLCLFLYFYFETMFEGEATTQICLQFLLNSLNPTRVHPAVHIQACTTFSAFVQDEEIMLRVENCLPLVLSKMTEVLPFQKEKAFFETLQELVVSDPTAVIPHISQLLSGLVAKIKQEQGEIDAAPKTKSKKKESIIIVKSWNIIRTVTDSKHIVPQYAGLVEDVLAPLFEYINVPEAVEFEDDIVLVWISLIKKCQAVTPRGWLIFERLPLVQRKYEGDFGQIFQALNAYLTFGKDVIAGNPQYLALLAEMSFMNMFSAPHDRISEPSCSEGALILQQMLLTFRGGMDQMLPVILEKTMKRYAQGVKNDFFKVRLLDSFLAALNYNTEVTVNMLTAQGQLKQLVVEILANVGNFIHSYDKKIAVPALLNLVLMEPKPAELAEMTLLVFEAVIVIILAKREAPAPQAPKPPAAPHFEDLLTDDDEKDDDDTSTNAFQVGATEGRGEEAEANLTLNSMISPLKDFDETEHFRKIIGSIATTSPQVLQALLSALAPLRKEQFKDLLQSKRVQISGLAGETTVVRKVVKAKRRLRK